MARQLAGGLSEPRALLHLMLRLRALFVASLPNALREARGAGIDDPVAGAVAAHLFGYLCVAPLLAYGAGGAGASGGARPSAGGAASSRRGRRCSGRRCSAAPLALALALVGVAAEAAPALLPWLALLGYAGLGLLALAVRRQPRRGRGLRPTGRVAAVRGRRSFAGARRPARRRWPAAARDGHGAGSARTREMWAQLVIDSLLRPRAAARRVLALELAARSCCRRRWWSPASACARLRRAADEPGGRRRGVGGGARQPAGRRAGAARGHAGHRVPDRADRAAVRRQRRARRCAGAGGLAERDDGADPGRAARRLALVPPLAAMLAIVDGVLGCSGPSPTSSPSCMASTIRSWCSARWSLTAIVLFFGMAMLLRDAGLTPQEVALMYDVEAVRRDFPILSREVHGRPLVYLDNGASAQKPQVVIDAVTRAYAHGIRQRSPRPALPVEPSRPSSTRRRAASSQRFLGAAHEDEIVFTTGSTDGDQPRLLRLGRAAAQAGRRDRADRDGAPRQHRALALPARAAGRGAEMGRHRAGRLARPAGGARRDRAADEAGRRHPHVERARHRRRRDGDLRRRRGRRACRCSSTAARRRCTCRWTSRPSAAISTRSPGTSSTGRPGSGAIYIRRERQAEMRPFLGGGDMIREVPATRSPMPTRR